MSFSRSFRYRLIGALGVALMVAALYVWNVFEPVELLTHDARFLMRGYSLASSDVVVVGITQQCVNRIGELPWNRKVYADAIRELEAAGAEVIVMDIFFSTPAGEEEDAELEEAMAEAGNVILPVFSRVELERPHERPVVPVSILQENLPRFTKVAAGIGHINIPPALDRKCRAVPPAINYHGSTYHALGIEAAFEYLGRHNEPKTSTAFGGESRLVSVPVSDRGNLLINYSGQQATFDFWPLHRVLEGRIPDKLVHDKLVLVGQTALGQINADLVTTPVGEMFGVFVQGTLMDNILNREFVRRQGVLSTLLGIFAVSLLAALIFHRLSPMTAGLSWCLMNVVLIAVAATLFVVEAYFLDMVPVAVTLAGNLGVTVAVSLRESIRQAQSKERELLSILESSRVSVEGDSDDSISDTFLALMGRTIGADAVSLFFSESRRHWQWFSEDSQTLVRRDLECAVNWVEEKVAPVLLETAEPYLSNVPGQDRLLAEAALPVSCYVGIPLRVRGRVRGLLQFFGKRSSDVSPGREFSEKDMRLVNILSQQCALLAENARLLDGVRSKNAELQEALRHLQEAQDELVRSEKLSTIGQMASMIIHDMRGPLTVAGCYAAMAGDPDTEREEIAEYAGLIREEITRINAMAQEIMDFSRGRRQLNCREIDPGKLMEDVRKQASAELGSDRMVFQVSCDLDRQLFLDRDKVMRVLMNLVRNGAEAQKYTGTLRLTCKASGDHAELKVVDQGSGIPEEIREKMFDPFVTHGKAKGTGLGLAIARKVVEDHGGTIEVSSAQGEGTTFVIRFPLGKTFAPESGTQPQRQPDIV